MGRDSVLSPTSKRWVPTGISSAVARRVVRGTGMFLRSKSYMNPDAGFDWHWRHGDEMPCPELVLGGGESRLDRCHASRDARQDGRSGEASGAEYG